MGFNQILAEWETISVSQFWRAYTDALKAKRALLSRKCETEKDPREYQGAIELMDFILGRNEDPGMVAKLLDALRKKSA